MSPVATDAEISRSDIEAKLRELRGGLDSGMQRAESTLKGAAVAVVVVLVVGAFLLGRRRGRRRKTLVEVRRV